ncbi:long-chain-fatty-acid--CoA ligase [Candidatus Poribacteria bacterium]|nr:long-chain-fatty-acid--CoA ligase [Candidatus Poribacteria bacterium]
MYGTMMNYPMTLDQILEHSYKIHGDKRVYTQLPDGEIHCYRFADLYNRVYSLVSSLREVGIQKGDRVATYAVNAYQHLELFYAIPLVGGIIHPLNIRFSPSQLVQIINHAEDKMIFVDNDLMDEYSKIENETSQIPTVWIDKCSESQQPENNNERLNYENFMNNSCETSKVLHNENWGLALCYTSGTSGDPRGVIYTHRSMFLHTLAANQADVFGITEKDVVMPIVPMFHALGWGIPYASMFAGADLVLIGKNVDNIIDLISKTGVTIAAGVPTVWTRILPELINKKEEISSLKRIIVGGEAIAPVHIETFEKELGIEIRHAWGMTEMSPTGTFCNLSRSHQSLPEKKQWTIKSMQGRPIPGVQIRIVDENDIELSWDGVSMGEVQVRSHWTSETYYKNGSHNKDLTSDGWLRTGDMATINPEGYLNIVDRKKAIIRSGGESISSLALEKTIISHPSIIDVAVIGIADETWGERPVAILVLNEPVDEISLTMYEYLINVFPKFWVPDKFFVVEEIPKNSVGKTDKNALRQIVTNCL